MYVPEIFDSFVEGDHDETLTVLCKSNESVQEIEKSRKFANFGAFRRNTANFFHRESLKKIR